jgi:hypothetical protein
MKTSFKENRLCHLENFSKRTKTPEKTDQKAHLGERNKMSKEAGEPKQPKLTEQEAEYTNYMHKKFADLRYYFSAHSHRYEGYDSDEQRKGGNNKTKFIKEIIWLTNHLGVKPISIVWEEIFPVRTKINFIGGKVTAEEHNENLETINKVHQWISDNLKG